MTKDMSPRVIISIALSALGALLVTGTVLFEYLEEEWTLIQSFYFTVVTITTVGYGDLTPSSDSSRLVTSIFILLGVGIAAGVITLYGNAFFQLRYKKKTESEKRSSSNDSD